jgi:hypothetical protein
MRPLNRPMFKMGGPVKEGIMDGIREPRQNFVVGGAALSGLGVGLRALASRLPAFLRPAGAATKTVPKLGPPTAGTPGATQFSKGFPGPKLPGTAGRGPGTAEVPLSIMERFRSIPVVARDPVLTGLTGPVGTGIGGKILGGLKSTTKYSLTTPTGLLLTELGFSPIRKTAKALFGSDDKPEEIVKKSNVGQVGKKTDDTKVEKDKETTNQFNDDGTKKATSVERLMKSLVKRARTGAGADTAIEVGRQLRTGEMSIKDPSGAIDVASEKFDKVSDLQTKVDLALVENELKKQQIRAQAEVSDKYLQAAKATGKPVEFVARKSLGIPTSISETSKVFNDMQAGYSKTDAGTQEIAAEWAKIDNKNYQGVLGDSDALKRANKIDEFKLNPESFILEKIEEIDGNDGLYVFGTNVFEYNNGVVKKIKN